MLFFAAFLEAVPVLGSFIPGSTVILSLSALIATGQLHFVPVLAATFTGAAIGDGTAFWIGHRHPDVFRKVWPLNRPREAVKRSEAFFQKHGGKAVVLARFLPPIRAFVPITAGVLKMPPERFFPLNLLAIVCWAPAHVVPGLLAGTVYEKGGALAEHLALPIIAGLMAVATLAWAYRRLA